MNLLLEKEDFLKKSKKELTKLIFFGMIVMLE